MNDLKSFSPEFFFYGGEPYDDVGEAYVNDDGEPLSVWSAILMLSEDTQKWAAMARDVFRVPKGKEHMLVAEGVLARIQATDTCTDFGSKSVEVWVDPEGDYRLKVGSL